MPRRPAAPPPAYGGVKTKAHFLKNMDLGTVLTPSDCDGCFTGTKMVATIGPACHEVEMLTEMLHAGMVGARIDLTWGPVHFHAKSLGNLQEAMKRARRMCSTMVDTLGREIMVRRQVRMDDQGWPTHEEALVVKAGQQVALSSRLDVEASSNVLPVTYERFHEMAQRGDLVYIGRYLVSGNDTASLYLEVLEVQGTEVICQAKNDAVLEGLLTVFHAERSQDGGVSNKQNSLPLLADYDKECLQLLAREYEIDFISLSYTRNAADVRECRAFLDSIGLENTKILAKLETRQSLLNLRGILNEADGIIMSRGNLGLDCVPEKMALIQKTLVQACNLVGKPAIITRVVDTMAYTPRPTRAEATDVANAVLDGADGILLGAETLRGRFPVETISTVCKIARAAEGVFDHSDHYEHLMDVALETEAQSVAKKAKRVAAAALRRRPHVNPLATDSESDGDDEEDITDDASGAPHWPYFSNAAPPPVEGNGNGFVPGCLAGPKAGKGAGGQVPHAHSKSRFAPHGDQSQDHGHEVDQGASPAQNGSGGHAPRNSSLTWAPGTMGGADASTDSTTTTTTPQQEMGRGFSSISSLSSEGDDIVASARRMVNFSASTANLSQMHHQATMDSSHKMLSRTPYLSKLESIASSAVRAAEKVQASMIVVYTHTGKTAQLVAKYRPPMPILTLVVPHLVSNGLQWKLEGRSNARQCLLTRGLLPVLGAPSPSGDVLLEEAVAMCGRMGLVRANDHVVCVQRVHDDFCVKIVSVDGYGMGIKKADPLCNMSSSACHIVGMPGAGQDPSTLPPSGRQSIGWAYDAASRGRNCELVHTLSMLDGGPNAIDVAALLQQAALSPKSPSHPATTSRTASGVTPMAAK